MRTKEIRLQGKKYRLTLGEIRRIDLIRKGLDIQTKIQPLSNSLKEVKIKLAAIGITRRGKGRMVRLDGIVAEAVVTWKRKITIDPEKAEKLKKVLGKKDFDLFFEERAEYLPTKNLNLLIKARDKGATLKKVKVFNALMIKENGPYVEIKAKSEKKTKRRKHGKKVS